MSLEERVDLIMTIEFISVGLQHTHNNFKDKYEPKFLSNE